MKRYFAILLAVTLLISLSTSFASAEGKEITWARSYDSSTLDPAEASDDNSINIVAYIGEGLVRYVNGEVVPGVAESWDVSADGLTYTFHLRQSTWSDGTPVTANDFVYSFIRLIDPANGHAQASGGYIFKNSQSFAEGTAEVADVGCKALDDYTLEVQFENTGLENLFSLTKSMFVPVKQSLADALETAYGSDMDKVLGNGPFVITEWAHEDRIVLEKNQAYWNADAIHMDKLTGLANVANDIAMEMMQTGVVDLCGFTDPLYTEPLLAEGFKETTIANPYQFLHINLQGRTEDTGRFLSNVNFRRALSYALDRTALSMSVLQGREPAYRLVDPSRQGVSGPYVDEYPLDNGINVTTDAEQAQYYLNLALEELGATLADVPEFSMLCYESPTSQLALQASQDMFLTVLGIHCVIDPQPVQQMMGKVFSYDYDFWFGGLGTGQMDEVSYDGILPYYDSSVEGQLFGYDNPAFNELLATAQTTLDLQVRKDTLFELEKIFCEDVPTLLLGWTTLRYIYRSDIILHGTNSSYGVDLAFIDLAE
ncbi:MAG TPA: peptide ABC transporter substrate-binding protein [Candidatus Limiplasma sp.]|nr:peptide ABC transporter substrate-binding protein [Candidatus Limiplasma sp.]